MIFNAEKVAEQIASLRKSKGITQSQLAERLGVSTQAISKWERGENLPDITLLPELATVLETTTDNILYGGTRLVSYGKKLTFKEAAEAIACVEKLGELLGKNSSFYAGAVEGIDRKMNIDFENYVKDSYTREALIAEAVIQSMLSGAYVDMSDITREFKYEHWVGVVREYAKRCGIV